MSPQHTRRVALRGLAWHGHPARGAAGHVRLPYCILILVVLLLAPRARAQATETKDRSESPTGETVQQFQGLWKEFEKLGDWQNQADMIHETMDRFWQENGWDSEADLFARRLAGEVAGIPPWDVTGRVSKMTDLVSERYGFEESQRRRLEASVYSEAGWFLVKNRKVLWDQTRDFLSKYSAGEPLTPELVAEWTRESDGLMEDFHERIDRMSKTLEKTMTPRQREILERDLESYRRRQAWLETARQRWAEGGWEPRDWGLEKDPAYAGWKPDPALQARLRREAAGLRERQRRDRADAADETTWERYVRRFVEQYKLDEAQKQSAYSMLHELQARARDYKETHRGDIERVMPGKLGEDPLGEPIQRMFEELKARLEPIPTAAQRQALEVQETGASVAGPSS